MQSLIVSNYTKNAIYKRNSKPFQAYFFLHTCFFAATAAAGTYYTEKYQLTWEFVEIPNTFTNYPIYLSLNPPKLFAILNPFQTNNFRTPFIQCTVCSKNNALQLWIKKLGFFEVIFFKICMQVPMTSNIIYIKSKNSPRMATLVAGTPERALYYSTGWPENNDRLI